MSRPSTVLERRRVVWKAQKQCLEVWSNARTESRWLMMESPVPDPGRELDG